MRYANNEAQDAFCWANENYGKPLALLEQSFNAAGMDIEFVCVVGKYNAKIVSIYRGGFLQRQQSIECDSPAQAVKDVAAGVRL
ncbi:MAG: hypothetical protein LBU82_08240 [Treponema sp.]|nr:hypothetical protein [Treponema sp.]